MVEEITCLVARELLQGAEEAAQAVPQRGWQTLEEAEEEEVATWEQEHLAEAAQSLEEEAVVLKESVLPLPV